MKNIFRKISLVVASILLSAVFVLPATAVAQSKADVCTGVGLASGTSGCTQPKGSPSVDTILKTVINILSLVIGIVAVIFVIVGGLKFITSSGDPANVSSAQKTIIYALVGLVIVSLAQVIVRFVLNKV